MTSVAINIPINFLTQNKFFSCLIKKRHPDILFEFPMELNIFYKIFIRYLRIIYPETGFDTNYKNNIHITTNNENIESYIYASDTIYFDNNTIYIAFDYNSLTIEDFDFIVQQIKKIIRKNVYTFNNQYPNFNNMTSRYLSIDITKIFNQDEIQDYSRQKNI
ncbi:hypothetical protein QKC54_gp0403 [Megavirus baoshan]|uniref:Uncharacterized protein n=1 Tax=Megavirus baoshan TaxID=2496520 RepID=A0A3S5HLA9_9VIRU|nr:hypothetical protein QKC54_gp0403 [Megavirus baoshan]AZL89422.1 hypothetical protein Mb0669 [Megavirus baoshan]